MACYQNAGAEGSGSVKASKQHLSAFEREMYTGGRASLFQKSQINMLDSKDLMSQMMGPYKHYQEVFIQFVGLREARGTPSESPKKFASRAHHCGILP